MKTTPKKKRDQKTAFRKKYGTAAGDLILSYRGKIAARANATARAKKKTK